MAKATKKAAVKKVTPKKAAAKKAPLKRSSFPKPDMPKLLAIFKEIKKLIKAYEPPFQSRVDIEGKYDLWSEKRVQAFGREYDSMYFAGLIIQTGYVGFYYMPIYAEPEKLKKVFKPEFLKLLKGKSCFHVKEWSPELEKHIKSALEIGYKEYKNKGWV